jgi:hypothetical protein
MRALGAAEREEILPVIEKGITTFGALDDERTQVSDTHKDKRDAASKNNKGWIKTAVCWPSSRAIL